MRFTKRALLTTLIVSVSTQVSAHVTFDAPSAKAGQFHVAGLRIFHGCDGSPTIKVTMEIPDGVTRVKPRAAAGWTASVAMKKLETPLMLHGEEISETVGAVTWEGGSLPDAAYEQFDVHMMMPDAPGTALGFPVHQTCDVGSLDWDETAQDIEAFQSLTHPTPFIMLDGGSSGEHPNH